MKTLSLSCALLSIGLAAHAHPGHGERGHPHGAPALQEFQPSRLGRMSELRAEILRVAGPKAPAEAKANPAAQAQVWAAEAALVAVQLEFENQFLAFTKAIDAEQEYLSSVPQQIRDSFKALVDKGAAAQKKAVDLGVLKAVARAGGPTSYVFAMRGQAPSAEAKKAVEDYVEAMAAFDADPDAVYVQSILERRIKSQPDSVPPALKAARLNFYTFTLQRMPVYLARGMKALGDALKENGGEFNSRWGFDPDGSSPKPGRKS